MPYINQRVEPKLFFEHNGVKVFNTYKNEDFKNRPMQYWFTCDATEEGERFDIRSLVVPSILMLSDSPPSLSSVINSEHEDASEETKNKCVEQWMDWYRTGGKFEAAVKVVLKEAIEMMLIKTHCD